MASRLLISSLLLAALLHQTAQAEKLYVFVPTDIRATVLQEKIQQACPALEVTVFGRSGDFRRQLKSDPPSAIIAPAPVVERVDGFNPAAIGIKDGKNTEAYRFLSMGNPLDINNLKNLTIGVVDILGRNGSSELLEEMLGEKVKVKRVIKKEDLLPLMMFGSADAVFVSLSDLNNIKSNSQAKLAVTPLNVQMRLTTVGLKQSLDDGAYIECIGRFNAELNRILGVEEWKK